MTTRTHAELREQFKDNPSFVRFVDDMEKAGIPVQEYEPRGAWGKKRPAATTSERTQQEISQATRVRLSEDTLGKLRILYP